jgi:hypothetical protein
MIEPSLFEGKTIRFTAVDPEQDYKIESQWTYNLDFARRYREAPVRPLAPHELKKYYEKFERVARRWAEIPFFGAVKSGRPAGRFCSLSDYGMESWCRTYRRCYW